MSCRKKFPGNREANKNFDYCAKIREVLSDVGFSETYTYAFAPEGEVEIANALASDKNFLRKDLTAAMKEKIDMNTIYVLFDHDPVKVFEIGSVFPKDGEKMSLAFGIGYKADKWNKSKEQVLEAGKKLWTELGMKSSFDGDIGVGSVKMYGDQTKTVVEMDISKIIADSAEIAKPAALKPEGKKIKFRKISQYPRIIRDVALFVPPEVKPSSVEKLIRDAAGELLVEGPVLFDMYEKKDAGGKVERRSLAFRMMFQSYEKTLSDTEANAAMGNVFSALQKNKGWQVR